MKKLISFLLILTAVFCLASCSSNKYKEEPADEFYLKHAWSFDYNEVNNAKYLLSCFYHKTEEFGSKVIISIIHNSDGDKVKGGSGRQYKYIEEFLNKWLSYSVLILINSRMHSMWFLSRCTR